MEGQSVAKIVQQITETLSDAVAQLVVLVIALQEQNAEMPATLPNASNAVAQASAALVQVARALAEDDYGDYPDIQEQINGAALGVEQSSANLIKAVQNMRSAPDRRAGWNSLVDACKIIAGKTILLLQIVYGAEIQRLFAAAEMARKALNQLDTQEAARKPQEFANAAGEAATRANQLAEYVRAKANDSDNPVLKKQLDDYADALQKDAEDLINEANALLANPSDKGKQKKFDDVLARTKGDIKNATELLEPDREQAEATLDQLRGKEQGGKLFATPKQSPSEKNPQKQLLDDDLAAALNRAKGLADKLEALANVPDPRGTADTLKQLQDAVADVKRGGQAVAQAADDPIQRHKVLGGLDALDRTVPPQKDAAGRAAATANRDDPSKRQLHDANKDFKRALDDIADAANPGAGTDAAAKAFERALDDVHNAANGGNQRALDDALRDLNDANVQLAKQVKEKSAPDALPDDRKQLLDSLAEIESLLPKEVQASKRVVGNPRDKKAQQELGDVEDDLNDALDRIKAVVYPTPENEIAAAAARANKYNDELADAAKRGDKPRVAQAANELQKQNAKLAKQARARAQKIEDPTKRNDLLAALDELERLLPDNIKAAQDVVSNPRDKRRQGELDDLNDDLAAAIAAVQRGINDEAPLEAAAARAKKRADKLAEAARSNPDGLDDALAAAKKANDDLLRAGRQAERDRDDPTSKRAVQTALDDVESKLPGQSRAAKAVKANPRDARAQKELADENDKLKAAIDNLVHRAKPSNKDKARNAAHDAADELERLLAALAEGDEPKAADAARRLAADHQAVADEARARAKNMDDPQRRKEIFDAVDALERLIPNALKATQDAVRNPRDKQKQKRVEDAGGQLRDAADNVLAALADSPEDAIAALANEEARLADDLQRAAHEGNPRGVELAAKALAKKNPKLAQQARAKAAQIEDADKRKALLDALDALDSLLPQQIRAAKEVTQAPDDKKKGKDLDDASDDLNRSLGKVSDLMAPRNPGEAILEAAQRAEKAGRQVKDGAGKGDKDGVEKGLRDLEDAIQKLKQQAQDELDRTDDPLARKALEDAIRELEELLRRLRPDALAAAANPRDKRSQDKLGDDINAVNAAAAKIIDAAKAGALADARKQEKDLDKLRDAARRNDPRGIAEANRAMAKRGPKLAEQARALAKKTDDPMNRKALLDAVDELEGLLPKQAAASLALARNPNDKGAQKNFNDAADDYGNALDQLNALLKPQGKDKLKNAADLADEQVEAVKNKARKGDGPGTEEELRKMDNIHDGVIQAGRAEAARQRDPSKRKALEDALDELERLLKDLADAGRKAARAPNDQRAQANLDDAANQYRQGLNDVKSKVDPSGRAKNDKKMAKAAAEVDRLLPQLAAANDKLKKNPNDAQAKRDLDDILAALERPLALLGDAFYDPASEEGKVHDAAKQYKKAIDDIDDAARKGDPQVFSEAAKKGVAAQQALIPKARSLAEKQDDPAKRKQILDALSDLEALLPQQIRAAQRAASNPRDNEAARDLAEMTERLKGAADRIDRIANPANEAAIMDDQQKIRAAGDQLKQKAAKGDKPGASNAHDDLLKAAEDMLARARKDAEREKDPRAKRDLEDALKRLEELLRKLKPDADKAAANPRDAKAQKDLADDLNQINDAAADLANKTKSAPIAEAEQEIDALDRMVASARRGDAKDVAEAAKAVAGHNQKLAEQARAQAQKVDDPARRKALLDAIADLEAMLPRQINAAKEVLTSPNDASKLQKLQQTAEDYKDPIARIEAAIKPSDEKEVNAQAAAVMKDLGEVKNKANAGDQRGTADALAKTRNDIDKLKDKARAAAQNTSDPSKRDAILKALDDLDRLFNDLNRDATDAARSPNDKQKQAKLDDTISAIKKPIDQIKENVATNVPSGGDNPQARAAAILASMRAANRSRNPMDLLNAANELASLLGQLTNDSRLTAIKEAQATGLGREALDLNDLLNQLDAAAAGKPAPQKPNAANLESLLGDLNSIAAAAPTKPGTLEDSLQKVAENIRSRSRTLAADPVTGPHTNNIGQELSKLAAACQKGERQQFLISARSIAGYVNALTADLRALAAKTQDPELKGRLMENAAALQNFSVQLKILASVRSASYAPNADSDKSLIVLTQNFGVILNSTISTVGVVRLKYPNI
eukprot:TRINITY_DN505_c0_g1_i1.p1 TRINITY_DN505_c0_g1~~TRINITY_DN505_c0_g1_i1.p1  ORF type:complete len:2168 (-),score=569.75 TRINITY_DN505_c0_g1_i1:84-6587(-)